MNDTATIPVRLRPEVIQKLDEIAAQHGLSRSALIKICVTSFVDRAAMTPLTEQASERFKEVLKDLDGRTHRYDKQKSL